jgi:hypothetical protein
VDGHADRPRLVRERPRDRLADPPGRVRRELVAPAPVELLDRADQAERAFLDQVEERQALVPVVLRDRDDEPEVRLDHVCLRAHVPALDLLGELDLLGGGQQRMASRLAEEELERVRRRLVRDLERGRRGLLLLLFLWLLGNLDPPSLELVEQRVRLEHVQLVRLDQLRELRLADRAGALCGLQQTLDVLVLEDRLDRDRHRLLPLCLGVPGAKRGRSQLPRGRVKV